MTFNQYCEERGIKLFDWQKDAAWFFLKRVHKVREFASGKTFLVKTINEFLSEHGNTFEEDK